MRIAAVGFLLLMCYLNSKSLVSTGSVLFVILCIAAIIFTRDPRKESQ